MIKSNGSRRHVVAMLATMAVLSGHGRGRAAEENRPGKPAFISLGEFTVNLPEEGGAAGYLVIGITLEVAPEAAAELNDIVPRLKDSVIQRLMTAAAQGTLQPGHADPAALKALLLDCVTKQRPDSVREVLITRLLYG